MNPRMRLARVVSVDPPVVSCHEMAVLPRERWPDGWKPAHSDDRMFDAQLLVCGLRDGHSGAHHDLFDGIEWEHDQ